jgi:hypothetical protein
VSTLGQKNGIGIDRLGTEPKGSIALISRGAKTSSQDTDACCGARCVRMNGTSLRPARGEVIFLARKIGWDGLVAAER